jgi:protein phosphatase 1 regulatory subunit 7
MSVADQNMPPQLKLKTLDVGNNRISKIENIAHLKNLEEFWVGTSVSPRTIGQL